MSDTIDPSSPTKRGLSRRTMVGVTAWSVPVIAVATSAPAFAATGAITFTAGTTAETNTAVGGTTYKAVRFTGASVKCTGAIQAGELKMIVTLTGRLGGTVGAQSLTRVTPDPTGWSGTSDPSGNTLTYVRAAASTANASVNFPDGLYFRETNSSFFGRDFNIQFSAGTTSSTVSTF